MIAQKIIHVRTERGKIKDITDEVEAFLEKTGIDFGIANIFVQHTTCSLIIQENETMLKEDIMQTLDEMVERPIYYHPANARSHLKAMVTGSSVTIPVTMGRLALGTWQRVLLIEFDRTGMRDVVITITGEKLGEKEREKIRKRIEESIELD